MAKMVCYIDLTVTRESGMALRNCLESILLTERKKSKERMPKAAVFNG